MYRVDDKILSLGFPLLFFLFCVRYFFRSAVPFSLRREMTFYCLVTSWCDVYDISCLLVFSNPGRIFIFTVEAQVGLLSLPRLAIPAWFLSPADFLPLHLTRSSELISVTPSDSPTMEPYSCLFNLA